MLTNDAHRHRRREQWCGATTVVLLLVLAALPTEAAHSAEQTRSLAREAPSTLTASTITRLHNEFDREAKTPRQVSGATLAYVTPWNGRGYDFAKWVPHKFTHVSPVWFDVKASKTGDGQWRVKLEGAHNVDQGWMSEVRREWSPEAAAAAAAAAGTAGTAAAGTAPSMRTKVVPRFLLQFGAGEFVALASDRALQKRLIDTLVHACRKHGLDGVVLEAVSAWHVVQQYAPQARVELNKFIVRLARVMHAMEKPPNTASASTPPPDPATLFRREFVLVVPPPRAPMFHHDDFLAVFAEVDWFSLMTYDFSSAERPGPNAPLPWVEAAFEQLVGAQLVRSPAVTRKVLIGLNFYGLEYEADAVRRGAASANTRHVLAHDVSAILADHPRTTLEWSADTSEHSFTYGAVTADGRANTRRVFYPTPQSLAARIALAQRVHAGISIWEIGQGMSFFFDLL